MIVIKNKKCSIDRIKKEYPDCIIIDVTSKAKDEFVKLSPFYPHRSIPIPGSSGFACSVEGIWQGLKVFENEGPSILTLHNHSMKGLKRSTRVHGKCLGHVYGELYNEPYNLLGYVDARKKIYIPAYNWVLENKCSDLVNKIRIISQHKTVILLDYNTNEDIENGNKPLSHASLIKSYLLK